jgi:hypothetical protein
MRRNGPTRNRPIFAARSYRPGVTPYHGPTPCDPDCTTGCHERHNVREKQAHNPDDCEQLQLGRDITPLPPRTAKPDPNPRRSRLSREDYAAIFPGWSGHRVSWLDVARWRLLRLMRRG